VKFLLDWRGPPGGPTRGDGAPSHRNISQEDAVRFGELADKAIQQFRISAGAAGTLKQPSSVAPSA
jgi:hypothetical protein